MHAERDTWTLFVTVVGLSLLVFCTNLTLLTYDQKEDINICPKYSKNLVGSITPNLTDTSYKDLESRFTWLRTGGHYTPTGCKPRERANEKPFNRGKLFNIGYKEAKKFNHTCFVFHDVDLIPENDKILYGCVRSPMHLSRAVDAFNYK
eukprot:XP_019921055.1 PREDICTED: beta-1,4-N-acetylgalactosaminyltransferase bre-4 isoform X2 [Crassostrea gigas]